MLGASSEQARRLLGLNRQVQLKRLFCALDQVVDRVLLDGTVVDLRSFFDQGKVSSREPERHGFDSGFRLTGGSHGIILIPERIHK